MNLSVNINKVALLRNARGSNLPDLLQVARDCEAFGADGITVHPRPDQRHVRYDDIPPLRALVTTEFNIEGKPDKDFLDLVLVHPPHQCTLVPDEPGSIYVWDLAGGAYVAPLPNPWTTAEIFSAGAWIEVAGPAPDIEVDPQLLEQTQPADTQATLPVEVANVGAAPLVWTLYETPLGESSCGGPGEVTWLSATPLGGTLPPGESETVDVTFDSTGLAPGTYPASLCFESDDPVDPLVQVAVLLTVDSMPFLDGFESGDTTRWSSTVP